MVSVRRRRAGPALRRGWRRWRRRRSRSCCSDSPRSAASRVASRSSSDFAAASDRSASRLELPVVRANHPPRPCRRRLYAWVSATRPGGTDLGHRRVPFDLGVLLDRPGGLSSPVASAMSSSCGGRPSGASGSARSSRTPPGSCLNDDAGVLTVIRGPRPHAHAIAFWREADHGARRRSRRPPPARSVPDGHDGLPPSCGRRSNGRTDLRLAPPSPSPSSVSAARAWRRLPERIDDDLLLGDLVEEQRGRRLGNARFVIVDTGVLVAAADRGDRHHERCAELARRGGRTT